MITSENIDNWLKEPHQLQEVSAEALQQFVQSYGYFQPIQYLRQLKESATDDAGFFALRNLYVANPVLLRELWNKAGYLPLDLPIAPKKQEVEEEKEQETKEEEPLSFNTVAAGDYFASQGIRVPVDLPKEEILAPGLAEVAGEAGEKSLLVMMTFSEWLVYMQSKNQKEREEEADKKALKTMWQKQKLAAAIEEEGEEIPENVFEMAVNSISRNEELVSESLAKVYLSQGKKKQAIEVYRKLSLQNPEKKTYFAAKIEYLQKDLEV